VDDRASMAIKPNAYTGVFGTMAPVSDLPTLKPADADAARFELHPSVAFWHDYAPEVADDEAPLNEQLSWLARVRLRADSDMTPAATADCAVLDQYYMQLRLEVCKVPAQALVHTSYQHIGHRCNSAAVTSRRLCVADIGALHGWLHGGWCLLLLTGFFILCVRRAFRRALRRAVCSARRPAPPTGRTIWAALHSSLCRVSLVRFCSSLCF